MQAAVSQVSDVINRMRTRQTVPVSAERSTSDDDLYIVIFHDGSQMNVSKKSAHYLNELYGTRIKEG